jgi:lysophospholipase L1-like esterase
MNAITWAAAATLLMAGLAMTSVCAEDAPKPIKVLLVGNSQCPTIVSQQLLEKLAASDKGGRPITVGRCIKGGASLRSHWEAGTGEGTARAMIASGAWDFVVLQDIYNVQEPAFQPYARQFHSLIKENGAKTVLFGTASILSDYPHGFERQHGLHIAMGRELGVPIVDASYAYIRYFGDQPSTERLESLFAKDRAHPGLWGSYMYSCLLYSAMTSRNPIGLAAPDAIPADVVRTLQETAWAQHQVTTAALADAEGKPQWNYRSELLRPFWSGDVVEGESVLFVRDEQATEARAAVLFPIQDVLSVRNSVGDVTYENGRDYIWKPGSREIVLPAGSRIVSRTPQELRRPAGSQKYALTHRDGNGEILFGGRLEYAEMQTCITYRHEPGTWKGSVPKFDPKALPRSVARLTKREPLTIVTLGDSISAGANASALYDAAPYQPAYPELVRHELAERFGGEVQMTNLAVGGKDTGWGLTQIKKVVAANPHLVILAFGMNDSSGRSPQSYKEMTQKMISAIRERLPECEFILVASMLGNRDWTTLKHEVFPQYRDALAELVAPGIALADLTSVWTGFLDLKKDWDQTGNGVNHPNDFGHRVYAQVITTLLGPGGT